MKKRLLGLAVAMVAFAVCAALSYAWFTNEVDPISTDVQTATIQIDTPSTWTIDTSLLQPGEAIALDDFELTNSSTREAIIEITPNIEGYLRMFDYGNIGTGPSSGNPSVAWEDWQNIRFLYASTASPIVPQTLYNGLVGNLIRIQHTGNTGPTGLASSGSNQWRLDYPDVSPLVLDTGVHTIGVTVNPYSTGGSIYLRVDDSWINTYVDYAPNNEWRRIALRLQSGAAHFNNLRKAMSESLIEDMITALVDSIEPGETPDFTVADGVVYTSTDIRIYWESGAEKFYVGVKPTATTLSFSGSSITLSIPEELGGNVDDGIGGFTPSYGLNENAVGDAPASARLNEQGALFKINLSANAVQGTKAAVMDVFSLSATDPLIVAFTADGFLTNH
jgi:hypothetical protein